MTQAIIVIGELRFRDRSHFERFKGFFADYDIFISTYTDYEKLCTELTSTYLLHSRDVEKHVCPNMRGVASKGALLEWFHLDQILKTYEAQLLKYDVLVKVRSDLALTENSWEDSLSKVDKGTMYMKTNFLFYARSDHFIKALKDSYPKIKTHYWGNTYNYTPLNYDNILNSGDDCTPANVRFPWLFLPEVLLHLPKEGEESFFALKRLIKEHYDFLADFNSLEHHSPIGCLRNNGKNPEGHRFIPFNFASEQVFCIESFNGGLVKNSLIPVGLMKGRHNFKFNPDAPPPPPLQWPTTA